MTRRRAEPLLRPRQARYLERLAPPRDALRREIERAAARHAWRIVPASVAALYESLAARDPAARIVELGCAVGYGTLHLARGAPEGALTAVDGDESFLALAREHLARGGVAERVELVAGAALDVLRGITGPLDLVVIDATRSEPRRTLDAVLPLVRVGGTVAIAGLLGRGEVADPALRDEDDLRASEIERFHPYLLIHPQLASVLLPLGDGVGLAVKRRPTMRELGGPF